jgi:hypothetical protein
MRTGLLGLAVNYNSRDAADAKLLRIALSGLADEKIRPNRPRGRLTGPFLFSLYARPRV